MIRIAMLSTLAFVLLLVQAPPLSASEQPVAFESGKQDTVISAALTSPAWINSVPHPISTHKPQRKYHKDPFEPPADKLSLLTVESYDPDNPNHFLDPSASADKDGSLFEPCRSFAGISNTGWNPPDPHLAVGPDHVVVVVNSSIAVYDKKTGDQLLQSTAGFWFQNTSPPPPSSFIFDPKVVYDPNPGRFIIFYLCTDDATQSSFLVSVSQTSDAMGDWYSYNLDATLNGTLETSTWPDYPGLGFDYDEAVYLSANMWQFGGGYLYAKVRILDKDALYAGTLTGWNDIWNLRYHDISTAFTVKPALTYSDADGEFLLSNIWYGANYTTFWKIIDPLGTPMPQIQPRVNLSSSYSSPPQAEQLGGEPTLSLVGPMTQEVVYRNGMLYTSFSQAFNWGSGTVSAIRLLGIDTATSAATIDAVFGADGIHYYFPAIYADPSDRVYAAFSRSSISEYVGIHYVEDFLSDPSSRLLRQGDNHRSGSSPTRWGDYGGIAADPDDQNLVWVFHEYAGASSSSWKTWIGQVPSRIGKSTPATPADAVQVETPVLLSWDIAQAAPSYELQLDQDSTFGSPDLDIVVEDNEYELNTLPDRSTYYWRVRGVSLCEESLWSDVYRFTVCDFLAGDADNSGTVNISDAVHIINFIFGGGPQPLPFEAGDTDCDLMVNISDAIYLIAYVFGNGPAPCKVCQ